MKERKELSVGTTEAEAIASFPAFDPERHEVTQCPATKLFQVFNQRKPAFDPTIRKPVFRMTRADFRHYKRKVIVGIEPGDLISFRLKGTRKKTFLEIDKAFAMALQWEAFATMAKKRAEKKARRQERKARA